MKGRLIIANLVGVLVIIALVMGGGYYYYQNTNYIKTDDARVAADMLPVMAPAAGVLTSWNAKEGDTENKKAAIGQISTGTQAVTVAAPMDGTLIKNEAKEGELVQPGTTLGELADMKNLYILANIDETDIKAIDIGSNVDVTVDGDPNTVIQGTVQEIGYATNSVFSLLPQSNSSGSYTKVTQKVQVKIAISNYSKYVLPGMNAEIVIKKK
jgi:multidrug resistance efflux pump